MVGVACVLTMQRFVPARHPLPTHPNLTKIRHKVIPNDPEAIVWETAGWNFAVEVFHFCNHKQSLRDLPGDQVVAGIACVRTLAKLRRPHNVVATEIATPAFAGPRRAEPKQLPLTGISSRDQHEQRQRQQALWICQRGLDSLSPQTA